MKRLLLTVALLGSALAVDAQIYQWQDENNKTVISDRPPASNFRKQKKIDAEGPPAGSESAKTLDDREMAFRKRQKESREVAEKTDKERRASAEKQENCEAARRSLKVLESGERVALRDAKGERVFMDDAQRDQEIARIRQMVQEGCK